MFKPYAHHPLNPLTWTLPTSPLPLPQAIGYAWELSTKVYGLPPERVWVSLQVCCMCYFSPEEGYLMENLLEPTRTPSSLPSPPPTPPPNGYEEVANLPPLTLPPPP